MSVMTICSAALGLIGALLGIVNTLSLLFVRRIDIDVHFEFAYLLEKRFISFPLPTTSARKTVTEKLKQGRVLNPSIRIVNKSKYTIFITDVGLSQNVEIFYQAESLLSLFSSVSKDFVSRSKNSSDFAFF